MSENINYCSFHKPCICATDISFPLFKVSTFCVSNNIQSKSGVHTYPIQYICSILVIRSVKRKSQRLANDVIMLIQKKYLNHKKSCILVSTHFGSEGFSNSTKHKPNSVFRLTFLWFIVSTITISFPRVMYVKPRQMLTKRDEIG